MTHDTYSKSNTRQNYVAQTTKIPNKGKFFYWKIVNSNSHSFLYIFQLYNQTNWVKHERQTKSIRNLKITINETGCIALIRNSKIMMLQNKEKESLIHKLKSNLPSGLGLNRDWGWSDGEPWYPRFITLKCKSSSTIYWKKSK